MNYTIKLHCFQRRCCWFFCCFVFNDMIMKKSVLICLPAHFVNFNNKKYLIKFKEEDEKRKNLLYVWLELVFYAGNLL